MTLHANLKKQAILDSQCMFGPNKPLRSMLEHILFNLYIFSPAEHAHTHTHILTDGDRHLRVRVSVVFTHTRPSPDQSKREEMTDNFFSNPFSVKNCYLHQELLGW